MKIINYNLEVSDWHLFLNNEVSNVSLVTFKSKLLNSTSKHPIVLGTMKTCTHAMWNGERKTSKQ